MVGPHDALPRWHEAPEALTTRCETLLAAHEPAWRGYCQWHPERVRAQARALVTDIRQGAAPGPWFGLAVSVKDNIGLGGWPIAAGSGIPLPDTWQRDAAIVSRLRRAGALFTGVTHTVPFCFTSLGVTLNGQGPRNPWDSERACGGSSSGAAVSVVEGSAQLALGSDTAGSVRVPAAMTGVVGLKLTHGRWPSSGMVPLSHSLDSLGLLARRVATLNQALRALEGERLVASAPDSLSGLRLGVLTTAPRVTAAPGIDEAFAMALRELEAKGARLVEVDFPQAAEADALFRSGGLVGSELESFLAHRLPAWRRSLTPPLDTAMDRAATLSAQAYRQRLECQARLARQARGFLGERGIDALLLPTTPLSPPRLADIASPAGYAAADGRILRHCAFINYLHWCAISLPIGRDAQGLPVGLQLAMPGFTEPRLLALAEALEACLGDAQARLGTPPRPSSSG